MQTEIVVKCLFNGAPMLFSTIVYSEYLNDKYIKGIIIKRRILKMLIIERQTTLQFSDINANKINIVEWRSVKAHPLK